MIAGPDGTRRHSTEVPLAAPVMVHDTAITSAAASADGDGWTVLLDLPLTVRPRRLLRNRFPVEYEPSHGARIGLLRRR